jgi:hypothetical protein
MMSDTPAIDEIDQDLHAACITRHEAWRALVIKDSTANRDTYRQACAEVDALLDMRIAMVRAEAMVKA